MVPMKYWLYVKDMVPIIVFVSRIVDLNLYDLSVVLDVLFIIYLASSGITFMDLA
jgi:hypothetical protein